MEIENISRPNESPVHGDIVKYIHPNGYTETKQYVVFDSLPTQGDDEIPLQNAMISRRQFFQALYKQDIITKQEAIAAIAAGTLPDAMMQLVQSLPAEIQDDAEFLIAGATEFNRFHPVTELIRQAFNWSEEQLTMFWNFAGKL